MNRRDILAAGLGTGLSLTLGGRVGARTGLSQIKIAFVGNSGIGKTSLLISYTTAMFPVGQPPVGFQTYGHNLLFEGAPTQLELADTPGGEDFDRLRPLAYPGSHVVALGFALNRRSSFDAIAQRWLPEIRQHLPRAPIILMGMKADLRDTGAGPSAPQMTPEDGEALARNINAYAYIENSGLTQHNLAETFHTLIRAARGEALPGNPPDRPRRIRPGQRRLTPASRPGERRGGN